MCLAQAISSELNQEGERSTVSSAGWVSKGHHYTRFKRLARRIPEELDVENPSSTARSCVLGQMGCRSSTI